MSARLLRCTWRWRQTVAITRRLSCPLYAQTYAIKMLSTETAVVPEQATFSKFQHQLPEQKSRDYTDLATDKAEMHDVTILLEKLEAQYKRFGNLNVDQYEKLLSQLESQKQPDKPALTSEQANFLLAACGELMPVLSPTVRLALFNRLWHYLQSQQLLVKDHYRTQLQVWQHHRLPLRDLQAYLQLLTNLEATTTQKADIYAELLSTVCSSGNMKQATEVLGAMREQQLPLTERNFNALLFGHGRSKDLMGCETVLNSMVAAGLPPSTETQTTLVVAFLENGATSKASDILHRFHRQFETSQILRMLRSALYTDLDESLITQLVRELPADYTSGSEVPLALRNLCIELIHNGKLSTVVNIITTLPTPTFNENQDIDTYGVFLLHELYRAQVDNTKVLQVAQLLKDSGKNVRALHVTIEMALRRNSTSSLPLLEALAKEEPLRPHYFWPLILHNLRRDGELGIVRTLKLMKQLDVECDELTLTNYVLPRLAISLKDPMQAVKWLSEAGLKTSLVLTPMLGHLLLQHEMNAAIKLLDLYPTKIELGKLLVPLSSLAVNVRATKRYHQYAKLLLALAKKSSEPKTDFIGQLLLEVMHTKTRLGKDPEAIRRLLKELQTCGVSLSSSAVDAIKAALPADCPMEVEQILGKMCERSLHLPNAGSPTDIGANSSFIKHPRDMSLEELECHLIELEAKRLNTRGVLRRLLQLCVREGRLKRALDVKAKCDALQVQVSPGMLASIFDMHIKLQDLPNAQNILQRMQQTFPGFKIDEHKIIDYATLLVNCKQLESAKQVLKQYAATQRIQGGDYVLKNVWNFLTAVAQLAAAHTSPLSKEHNWTRDTYDFLRQLGYCRAHNAVLGPMVREYLLRNDIHAAVSEFRRLAEQHKHTPLQFELLSLLVRLCNAMEPDTARFAVTADEAQKLLTEATDVVKRVHGAVNLNSALLLAFAESGTDNQLRRLLIDPEFRINQELLVKNCEHLGQEGAVQTLLRLARGARGLSRIIDEQSIYNMLLQTFVNANNYAAALDLFERLESDDELKISQEFLRNLVKLLKLNNLDIPSNIALRAQVI